MFQELSEQFWPNLSGLYAVSAHCVATVRMQKVKGRGHMRPKIDLKAWWEYDSWPPWVESMTLDRLGSRVWFLIAFGWEYDSWPPWSSSFTSFCPDKQLLQSKLCVIDLFENTRHRRQAAQWLRRRHKISAAIETSHMTFWYVTRLSTVDLQGRTTE